MPLRKRLPDIKSQFLSPKLTRALTLLESRAETEEERAAVVVAVVAAAAEVVVVAVDAVDSEVKSKKAEPRVSTEVSTEVSAEVETEDPALRVVREDHSPRVAKEDPEMRMDKAREEEEAIVSEVAEAAVVALELISLLILREELISDLTAELQRVAQHPSEVIAVASVAVREVAAVASPRDVEDSEVETLLSVLMATILKEEAEKEEVDRVPAPPEVPLLSDQLYR